MTTGSASGAASSAVHVGAKSRQQTTTTTTTTSDQAAGQAHQNQHPCCPSSTFNPSTTFQQIKQTQASLARLSRVHQLNNHQSCNVTSNHHHHHNSQSSQLQQQQQQQQAKSVELSNQQQQKPTTFVDCLIRRFKDCFSEDFCTVPMFVVGNLSPGSDGTHLILPPCVSLGSQNINRFSCPKNLRLMNSIRESCRSIEELDLSGNKLTDLIEVYKILQCTQNLKFLNLSENDLSRTPPVAMAASSYSHTSSSSPPSTLPTFYGSSIGLGASSAMSASLNTPSMAPGQWSSLGSSATMASRSYLAPINQNQPPPPQPPVSGLGSRRHHSTLGQSTLGNVTSSTNMSPPPAPSSSSTTTGRSPTGAVSSTTPTRAQLRPRPTTSRVAEARRLAAANALAQSKKTSSMAATKQLASSAAVDSPSHRQTSTRSLHPRTLTPRDGSRQQSAGGSVGGPGKQVGGATATAGRLSSAGSHHHHHHQTKSSASTMYLARSLSSLSAKDVRGSSSSVGRVASSHRLHHHHHHLHRLTARRGESSSEAVAVSPTSQLANKASSCTTTATETTTASGVNKCPPASSNLVSSSSGSGQRDKSLFEEDQEQQIGVETDGDVVMGAEQQVSPNSADVSSSCATQPSSQVASTPAQATTMAPSSPSVRGSASSQATNTGTIGLVSISRPTTYHSNSNNNTVTSTTTTTNHRRTFGSIKALALNNTGCPWRVVCSILSRMPNLEELHLSLNNYERIDLDVNEFRHFSLKRLYLCNNPKLTNWEELDKLLIAFPSLEALSIADCNISQIPDNLDRAREWRKLCGLNINGWPIKEWPVVERLNQLPSLIDLKCRNLEVLQSIDEPREHLIARLPKLQRLNGSEIEEREHAEKAFLRFFMANSHLERPRRFHELLQIHGEVVVSRVDVDVDLSPPSQAQVRVIYLNRDYYTKENEDDILMSEDFLVKLMDHVDQQEQQHQSLPPPDDSPDEVDQDGSNNNTKEAVRLFKDQGQQVVSIQVDLRQTVRKFKSTIGSIFGLKGQDLILYYIDHEMVGLMGPEVIKHNQKKLWNYNVQDGDQFIVEER